MGGQGYKMHNEQRNDHGKNDSRFRSSDPSSPIKRSFRSRTLGSGSEAVRALLVMDVSNLYYCVKKQWGNGYKFDYEKFMARIGQEVNVVKAIAYGADMDGVASGFKAILNRLGFETKYKEPKIFLSPGKETRKADWDVGIAMDVARLIDSVDLVIFCTADGDLAPCLEYVRERNKECWVIGSGISYELKNITNYWFEIYRDDLIG